MNEKPLTTSVGLNNLLLAEIRYIYHWGTFPIEGSAYLLRLVQVMDYFLFGPGTAWNKPSNLVENIQFTIQLTTSNWIDTKVGQELIMCHPIEVFSSRWSQNWLNGDAYIRKGV